MGLGVLENPMPLIAHMWYNHIGVMRIPLKLQAALFCAQKHFLMCRHVCKRPLQASLIDQHWQHDRNVPLGFLTEPWPCTKQKLTQVQRDLHSRLGAEL